MNCAEPVKPRTYPVEAPRKPVPNTKARRQVHARERERARARRKRELGFDPCRSVARLFGDKTNAARPATRPHRSWIPACLVTAWRRNDRFSPATPAALSNEEAQPWPKRVAHSSSCDDKGATAAAASGPCFLLDAQLRRSKRTTSKRGRPQRPGNQSRSRAFLISPPAIHPRESPVAAGSAAIIRQAQELSRFAEPTLIHFVAPRNRKNFSSCAETVDDVSSLWKPEEN